MQFREAESDHARNSGMNISEIETETKADTNTIEHRTKRANHLLDLRSYIPRVLQRKPPP